MARLTRENWKSIRDSWEYDVDLPSYSVAAKRAAEKYKFDAPDKSSVCRRADLDKKQGSAWDRLNVDLEHINENAHRKADTIILADGSEVTHTNKTQRDSDELSIKKAQATKDESEDLRAEVIARHRQEWKIAIGLRNEALQDRKVDIKAAIEKARLAKIAAEVLQIQQNGERKAWGLNEINIDVSLLSDAQLQDLINGKLPR